MCDQSTIEGFNQQLESYLFPYMYIHIYDRAHLVYFKILSDDVCKLCYVKNTLGARVKYVC